MIKFSYLAVLYAALAGITSATSNDGINPVRRTLVDLKTTAIEQKNRLCPACIKAAADALGDASLTLYAEQFVPAIMSGAQFDFMDSQLVFIRY